MLLLQTDVLGGNKLNFFNAMQVLLGGPTQILIWGCRIAKGATRSIKRGPRALVSRRNVNLGGDQKFYGEPMNPNDAMTNNVIVKPF